MATAKDNNVHDLLNTLLVPTYHPNRSQWTKLELAMELINISKKRVKEAKSSSKNHSAKETKKTDQNIPKNKVHEKPPSHEPQTKKP